jgi:hypothetical protein
MLISLRFVRRASYHPKVAWQGAEVWHFLTKILRVTHERSEKRGDAVLISLRFVRWAIYHPK